jgi:hypothetical protein
MSIVLHTAVQRASVQIIEIEERDTNLLRELEQRHGKCAERNHKQNRDPAFVLDLEKGAAEGEHNEHGDGDAAGYRPQDRVVDHFGAQLEARKVLFQPRPYRIVIRNRIQCDRPIEYAVEAGDQDSNKPRESTEHEGWSRGLGDDSAQLGN